jgi:ribosomal protein L10
MPGTIKKELIIQNIQNNFSNSKAVIFYNFHQSENREIFHLKKELKNVGSH